LGPLVPGSVANYVFYVEKHICARDGPSAVAAHGRFQGIGTVGRVLADFYHEIPPAHRSPPRSIAISATSVRTSAPFRRVGPPAGPGVATAWANRYRRCDISGLRPAQNLVSFTAHYFPGAVAHVLRVPPAVVAPAGATGLPAWSHAWNIVGQTLVLRGPRTIPTTGAAILLGPVLLREYFPLLGLLAARARCPAGPPFPKIICTSPPRLAHEAGPSLLGRRLWAIKVAEFGLLFGPLPAQPNYCVPRPKIKSCGPRRTRTGLARPLGPGGAHLPCKIQFHGGPTPAILFGTAAHLHSPAVAAAVPVGPPGPDQPHWDYSIFL